MRSVAGRSRRRHPACPTANVQLAYVATDEVIAIGSSPDFIKHVLDAGAGASLADDARYTDLLGRVDASHSGVSFLDLAAIRGLVEGAMATASAAEKAEYEESIKPFLEPVRCPHVDGDRRREHRPDAHDHHGQVIRGPQPRDSPRRDDAPMAVRIRLTRVGATKQPTYRAGRRRRPQRA